MENVDLEGIAYMWNEVFTWSKEQLKRFGNPYGKLKELADPKYPKSVKKPELEDVCSRSFQYMDCLMETVDSYRNACTNLQSQLIETQQTLISVQKSEGAV